MPEIPDVATLTTISKDWGNQIRSRTIQRYSSVAGRTTEHPTPAEGDLAYLEDSNTVWFYDGSIWVQFMPGPGAGAFTASGLHENTGTVALSVSHLTRGNLNIAIPADWVSYEVEATATWWHRGDGASTSEYIVNLQVGGTDLQGTGPFQVLPGVRNPAALNGRRTGITSPVGGNIAVHIFMSRTSGDSVTVGDLTIYARAFRLT